MILLVGLGNPGEKYAKTRHNVGFILIDAIAFKYGASFNFDKKFNADLAEIKNPDLSSDTVILVKPHTFMNNSGEAVQKISSFYKIPPEDIWLIYDELDLPLGQMKIRKKGSAGTHNGVKSVVALIGENFPRFRIGIESRGTSASTFQDAASFVLSEFFGPEKEEVINALDRGVKAIETAFHDGMDTAMNKFN